MRDFFVFICRAEKYAKNLGRKKCRGKLKKKKKKI